MQIFGENTNELRTLQFGGRAFYQGKGVTWTLGAYSGGKASIAL